MDNSQSSDVFSDHSASVLSSCNGSAIIMDVLDYDSLLHNTKASLCNNVQIKKISFSNHFTSLLEDCRLCITQSFDFVVNILSDANILPSKLSQYMANVVSLLQMLSDWFKNVVESITMSCCSFKTFPATTGHIILLVFTHCKNSEAVYGVQLKNMQMQLKDLFRTCHELQLTYLMVLEKHFIFDLSERDQLDIIIEALDINLKIGEVVQSLDVKTMAEQWKAYTSLCEKYSSHLMDKLIYQQCAQSLCCMVRNHLKTALEVDQDEKVIMRSLKVTNFVIKIMLKMCIIFKHSSLKDYSQLVEMLNFVHLHNPSYLELEDNQPQLISGMTTNICIPTDVLLMELIWDEKFVNVVISYNVENISKDEKLLGHVILIASMMKCAVERGEQLQGFPKTKLLECVFRCLPYCHMWINIGLKFQIGSSRRYSFGLFEYILLRATALALTVNSEEMCHLERIMYEAMLGTDSVTALFASSLWAALAKLGTNRQLLQTQIISLCHIYQKLESHTLFSISPQKYHLAHTINILFECMRQEDRLRISRQFKPLDCKNASLWIVLKISNLPCDVQRNVQEEILERFKHYTMADLATTEAVDSLVEIMMLAASCSFTEVDDDVEECLIRAWMKACPKNYTFLVKTLDVCTVWYFRYVEALAMFTCALEQKFYQNSANLIKVLHVILNIIKISNTELNLLLLDLLCDLAIHPVNDENNHSAASLVNESLRTILLQDCSNNNVVRSKLFRIINAYDSKRLEQIISSLIAEDPVLQELCDNFFRSRKQDFDKAKLKEQLIVTGELKYVHKCIESKLKIDQQYETVDEIQKTCTSNFDFADLDTLFDESDSEQPVSKKIKLDGGEAQAILNRLENDTTLLCKLKENLFTGENRKRIKDLCEKLRSLVD